MKEVYAPSGSQLLFYPMEECTISAGYKNAKYRKDYGYVHYGVDFDDRWGKDFNVLASGEGKVLGTEKNNNSIGGVVVIQYDNVFNPTTKLKRSLIVRYYHLYNIKVKKGQIVKAYEPIGVISGSHKWWNHIHFEIDTDIKHPFHTPQVAEGSSKLLIRKGATATTLLNPIAVLVVGKKQTARVHSLAVYAQHSVDSPRYSEGNPPSKEEIKAPVQKLILPIDDAKVTCGYKNAYYKTIYKMHHYGLDLISISGKKEIKGLGKGTVIAAGWDGVTSAKNGANAGCGYVLIVKYENVYNHNTKKPCDVICTLMHMQDNPLVRAGDTITTETLLGYYGGTGAYVSGDHLHIQFDTDIKYPLACMPMAATGHKILKRGTVDTTVEPCYILHRGKGQTVALGKYEQQYDSSKVLGIPSAV